MIGAEIRLVIGAEHDGVAVIGGLNQALEHGTRQRCVEQLGEKETPLQGYARSEHAESNGRVSILAEKHHAKPQPKEKEQSDVEIENFPCAWGGPQSCG